MRGILSIVKRNSAGAGVAGVPLAGGSVVAAGAVSVTSGDPETGKDGGDSGINGGDSGTGGVASLQAHRDAIASSTIIIAMIFFTQYLLFSPAYNQ